MVMPMSFKSISWKYNVSYSQVSAAQMLGGVVLKNPTVPPDVCRKRRRI